MSHQEDTPPASPVALAVEREMRAAFAAYRGELKAITDSALDKALSAVNDSERRVLDAVIEWGTRLSRLELAQEAYESRTIALENRLSTLPCAPPSEAADAE